jgi:HPt (histidine-containing phosphotransfer) domain-containing protein
MTEHSSERAVVLDRTRIDQYKALRPGFLERLVTAYLSESATYLSKIRTHTDGSDLAEVRLAAHSLKSASYNLGASRLGAHCQEIEAAAMAGDEPGLALLVKELGVIYFDAEQALRGVLLEARAPSAA